MAYKSSGKANGCGDIGKIVPSISIEKRRAIKGNGDIIPKNSLDKKSISKGQGVAKPKGYEW